MTLIFRGNFGRPREPWPEFCAAAVLDSGRSVTSHQCAKKPTCVEVVDGKSYGFCAIHAPSRVAARRAASNAKWAADLARKNAMWERQAAIKAATARCVQAMAEMRDGHNAPRGLAAVVLALVPDQALSRNSPEKDAGK